MQTLTCDYRDHRIQAQVLPYPDSPMPWAAGCLITDTEGQCSKRLSLPLQQKLFSDFDNAQHAALAHGKWLIDQKLDHDHGWS